jgi:hypothetical protein
MGRYSIEDFIQSTGERDLNQGVFELERERLLEVNLEVWSGQKEAQWLRTQGT